MFKVIHSLNSSNVVVVNFANWSSGGILCVSVSLESVRGRDDFGYALCCPAVEMVTQNQSRKLLIGDDPVQNTAAVQR